MKNDEFKKDPYIFRSITWSRTYEEDIFGKHLDTGNPL